MQRAGEKDRLGKFLRHPERLGQRLAIRSHADDVVARLLIAELSHPSKPPNQVDPRGVQRLRAFADPAFEKIVLAVDLVLIGFQSDRITNAGDQFLDVDRFAE